MRNFRLVRFGSPEGIERHDEAIPAGGAYDVTIRVRAAALNYRDVMIMNGVYPIPVKAAVVPLSDGAGEVVEVGANVSRFVVGDRVCSTYFMRWFGGRLTRESAVHQFGATHDGWLTTYHVADESGLVKIPEHLSFEEAACYPCAGLTAWSAIMKGRPLLPGEQCLVVGGGGVALFAIQFARLAGARVISVTTNPAKAALMRRLGADHVVVAAAADDWSASVLQLTAGRGVDHVVDAVGPPTLMRSIMACGLDAEIALAGAFPLGDAAFDPGVLMGRLVTIRRLAVGSREDAEDMMRAVADHRHRPTISRVFPFDDASAAYGYLIAGGATGKLVIEGNTSE
ncbi:zinc-dependent alcohol dehydrogenase family protein [Ciceribacter azotifigens]|uniref:zinc-dependent alcohol dehydrogenase family protein n=1 Tax=Ciceribacter azotifigens TaxID=2069303 RepID=UPI003A89F875